MFKPEHFKRELLEKKGGLLIYVVMIYSMLIPYFKDIRLTLENWRDRWYVDGWKLNNNQIQNLRDSTFGSEDVKDVREFESKEDDEDNYNSIGGRR